MKVLLKAHVVIRDKNGKVVREFTKPCKSYVAQFIGILRCQMSQLSTTIKDITGTDRSVGAASTNLAINAGASDATSGIQVGTGDTAVTVNDYKLQTLIAHGNGAGQLSYGAVSTGAFSIIGSTAQFTVARTMTNNSGASITVKEVGLVCRTATYTHLAERTLLEFAIANTESGTVTYTISITV